MWFRLRGPDQDEPPKSVQEFYGPGRRFMTSADKQKSVLGSMHLLEQEDVQTV